LFGAADYWLAVSSLAAALIGLVLGAIAGSFIATVHIRWPEGRSALFGRSRCDICNAPIAARDLVPVVSYFVLRGLCRRCGVPIDPRHVAIEMTAAALGMVALVAQPGLLGFIAAMLGWWLLLIAIIDLQYQWLPDRLTLPLIPLGLLAAWAGLGADLRDAAIGAAAGFAVLFLIAWGYRRLRKREGLESGDLKLFAALGAWLGWQQLPLVLVGAGLLGLVALLLMRARGETVTAAHRLPFGTFVAAVAWPIWLVAFS
jgi:leader peptidase (prepilin peptidase) / N-methyltransferase